MSDYFLEPNGDLVLDQNGDIQFALGWDEIEQFCQRLLITCPQGVLYNGIPITADYIYDPTFGVGLPRLIGNPYTDDLVQKITLAASQAVLSNEDIANDPPPVISVSQIAPFGFQVLIDVTPINGTPGTLGVIFTP